MEVSLKIYQTYKSLARKINLFSERRKLLLVCSLIAIFFWLCSLSRHLLFQSNAYDLGLFDQYLWLISRDFSPVSSIVGVHVLADHGAWLLYVASIFYKIHPNINWLFITQAIGLSFTAIPLWLLAQDAGLDKKQSWIICSIWWLQPVVFNTNLFDFHPEVWAMPALACSYLMYRKGKPLAWTVLCFIVLGSRDGMVLIIAGIGVEQFIRKKYIWSLFSIFISISWFAILIFGLYPYLANFALGGDSPTLKTIDSLSDFIFTPIDTISNTDFGGGFIYLILISIAFIPFWNRNSLPTLSAWLPLITLNFFGHNPSYRTLIHHYNLPIALIGVISVIDALSSRKSSNISLKKIVWISICWIALAKPYFFLGPYLSRVSAISTIKNTIGSIKQNESVLTTSYIAPHISQRKTILFSQNGIKRDLKEIDVILLNPLDPGWDSSKEIQNNIIQEARSKGWDCLKFENGLEFCRGNGT